MHGVPGQVYATKGGDFIGAIDAGYEMSAMDRAEHIIRRHRQAQRARMARARRQGGTIGSLDAALAAYFGGGNRTFLFNKAGTTGVVNSTNTLWYVGNQPAAGAAAGAAPGGTVPTSATTGAWPFDNPASGTQHFVFGNPVASAAPNTLLLYDRLFSVTKTMNSTATEAVSGTPTRYQSATTSAADYAGNNFLMIECRTALAATAHNWTVCTYTDQDGNTGATLPSVTGNSGNIINRLDQPAGTWFCPLAGGDTGIRTSLRCSARLRSPLARRLHHRPRSPSCRAASRTSCEKDGLTTSISLEDHGQRLWRCWNTQERDRPRPTMVSSALRG